MTQTQKNNDYYFSGGLAEFVPNPTPLTYSFFSYWFTGAKSLGKAMKLLGLPYENTSLPILEIVGDDVYENLLHEELTLYKNTLFSYKRQKNVHDVPQLTFNITKFINPSAWTNTIKITRKQSEWIAFPEKVISFTENLLSDQKKDLTTIKDIDDYLSEHIWPHVIAIGTLAEFYYQLLEKEVKSNDIRQELQSHISFEVAQKDWFFQSFSDQQKVKNGEMKFESYINLYGNRADTDYEIASPRWKEMPEDIKKRITVEHFPTTGKKEFHFTNKNLSKWTHTAITLMIQRAEAKKHALYYIEQLRKEIISKAKTTNISFLERTTILSGDFSPQTIKKNTSSHTIEKQLTSEGKGRGVSAGDTNGKILHIANTSTAVPPNTICVFPNASPQFAMLYPKCQGIIFLKGGQTSHGAIVAREFGIPAIISDAAETIPDGEICHIHGLSGSWEISK